MSSPRYSQPLAETPREASPVVFAGFVGGEVGFILRQRGEKEIRTEATRANSANERPRGFFSSLARLWAGGRT
jgi:hypothetical protein